VQTFDVVVYQAQLVGAHWVGILEKEDSVGVRA